MPVKYQMGYFLYYILRNRKYICVYEISRKVNSGLILEHNFFVPALTAHFQINNINIQIPLPKCTSLQPAIYRCDLLKPANGNLFT